LESSGEEENEPGDEFGMFRREEKGDLASETAGNQDGGAAWADRAEKFREGFDMLIGLERGRWSLGFSVTDQIRRDDFAVHGEAGVNLRPFIRRGTKKHPMKENQRGAGAANMENKIPVGGIRYARSENSGRYLVGNPTAV
jgi:hypothetical protein